MSSTRNDDNGLQGALRLLRENDRFLLSGHVRPDGDCIGAQAALAVVLRSLGKEVRILNPDPPDPTFAFFTKDLGYEVFRGGELPEHDVAVLLDISELSRCGALGEALAKSPSHKLVVDHHLFDGEPWWTAAFVDMTASATGLLVHRLASALGVELDATAATGVFVSLVSDTGWFKYSNTDAETLLAAGHLVERGVDPNGVYDELFQRESPSQPLWLAGMLGRTVYHADGRLAVFDLPYVDPVVTREADGDPALDILRAVEAVEVVLFLRELEGGACKLSARSKGDYDVNALARAFGGGGHRKASGATISGSLEEVRERVVEAAVAGFEAPVGGER